MACITACIKVDLQGLCSKFSRAVSAQWRGWRVHQRAPRSALRSCACGNLRAPSVQLPSTRPIRAGAPCCFSVRMRTVSTWLLSNSRLAMAHWSRGVVEVAAGVLAPRSPWAPEAMAHQSWRVVELAVSALAPRWVYGWAAAEWTKVEWTAAPWPRALLAAPAVLPRMRGL